MSEYLIFLNFNLASKGFNYWLTAFELYKERQGQCSMSYIYTAIAKIYETKPNRVERSMRHARENCKIKELYNYNSKLDNMSVLRFLYLSEREVR